MDHILPLAIPFLGSLLGVVGGAWLSNFVLPFRLKRKEFRWEKEIWASEFFFETVSRIYFIANNYRDSEYGERYSMSGLRLDETEEEITRLTKKIHETGHKLSLYLSPRDTKIFEKYLRDSQDAFDEAKSTWGSWYEGDNMAIIEHTENTIAGQGKAAQQAMKSFTPYS